MQDIIISENEIRYGNTKLELPFSLKQLTDIFGQPREEIVKSTGDDEKYELQEFYWDEIGFSVSKFRFENKITSMIIYLDFQDGNRNKSIFDGEIIIGNKEYLKCKWKEDDEATQYLKIGSFELYTLMKDKLSIVDEDYKELAELMSSRIEIKFNPPRKLVKYKFHPIDEPELKFSDFNFKLAVIQRLMYEKEVLLPKFDVEEFAEEYPKREIDTLEEGDEPIKEVVNWFKKLQIPVSLADEVDEIHMDGGNDIYLQIIPYWDGEDDYFDLKKVTSEDLAQFKNLKKMTVMSRKYKQIAKVLEENGIEAKPL